MLMWMPIRSKIVFPLRCSRVHAQLARKAWKLPDC